MNWNKEKLYISMLILNIGITGLCFSVIYLVKFIDSNEFIQDYMQPLNIDNAVHIAVHIDDIELLKAMIVTAEGETDIVFKMSQYLTSDMISLIVFNSILFLILLLISIYFIFRLKKKDK